MSAAGAFAQQPSAAPSWAIASSPARFTVEIDPGSAPAPLTWTDLKLPDPRWAGMTIRVFTDGSVGVGSEVLFTTPDDSTVLLFDSSSGAKHYSIYFGASDWPPLPLKDDHQGVMLETRAGDGREFDELADLLDAFAKATVVEGRAIVPSIFEGGNRFGPEGNALLHFRGYFNAALPEHLEFALISTDSSFLQVDGKQVVAWPGAHDWGGGMHGEHTGAVELAAGVHQLDYYGDYFQPQGPPLLACLAVKGGALEQWTMLTPGTTFFTPTAHAHVVDYTAQPGAHAPRLALDWTVKEQSVINPDNGDVGFVTLTLTCRPPPVGTVKWTFDDGTTAQGEQVDHVFPRPGQRTVQVDVAGPTAALPPVRQIIAVHPDWHQLSTSPPALVPAEEADIAARDPNMLSPSDLVSCAAVFGTFKATDPLLKLLPILCAKLKDVTPADLPDVQIAADSLVPDLAHAAADRALLQALIDRCGTDPALVRVAAHARLYLAQLTLLTTDHLDDVKTLLAAVAAGNLSGDDQNVYFVLLGDDSFATGDFAQARKRYEARTAPPSPADRRSDVRTTGRIGQARAYLDRHDTEAAETALGEAVLSTPAEKLSPEWALTRLRLYQEENLPVVALVYAQRLLPLVTGEERPELLYRLTDLANQQGDHELAARTLAELLTKHPYSPEAAQAKAKWPAGL